MEAKNSRNKALLTLVGAALVALVATVASKATEFPEGPTIAAARAEAEPPPLAPVPHGHSGDRQ